MADAHSGPHRDIPVGWDESRIRNVISHYESQSDEEAIAEDETLLLDDDAAPVVTTR